MFLRRRRFATLVSLVLVGTSGAWAQDVQRLPLNQNTWSLDEQPWTLSDKLSILDDDPWALDEKPWAQYDDFWAVDAEPVDIRDWRGIKRDLVYLIGWQVVASVIIYNVPFEYSNWSRDEKDDLGFKQWGENVLDPVWDEDHWAINYVLHPYWGAGYYIRGRERGFSKRDSFWVAVVFSSVYEFGVESFMEQPSIQDLIVTPVVGTALGLYFEKVRDRIRGQLEPLSGWDKFKLGLTDPFGALNSGVNRIFGLEEYADSKATVGVQFLQDGDRDIDGLQLTFEYRW